MHPFILWYVYLHVVLVIVRIVYLTVYINLIGCFKLDSLIEPVYCLNCEVFEYIYSIPASVTIIPSIVWE